MDDKNESGKLFGATGGFQAIKGTMFGLEYKPGSFLDKLTETYAGQHDLVGGQLFFYDKYGNGKQGLSAKQEQYIDYFSIGAVGVVTPTTIPHTLPIEVMNLLFGAK